MLRKVPLMLLLSAVPLQSALANNVGENQAWQFDTANDRTAKMYLEEVRQRRLNGYYSAPIYNTYIEDQYNCSVNSTATGNESSSNAVANSPSTSGHNSDATANASETNYEGGGVGDGSTSEASQQNDGSVDARSSGEMSTSVRGDNFQALNTDQVNSGNQSAAINGSTACQYAAAV